MRRRRTWWVETCESERGAKVFWLPAGMAGPSGRRQPRRLWGPYPTGPAADRAMLALKHDGWTLRYHGEAIMGPAIEAAGPSVSFWATSPRSRPPKPARKCVALDEPDLTSPEYRREARRLRLARLAQRAAPSGEPVPLVGETETVGKVKVAVHDGRVFVRFPHYLSAEQYARVHDSGFYWSASRQAFSRKHSDAALHAARTIAHDVEGIP